MPIVLPPNVLPHFYRGGSRLATLRGFVPQTDFGPEDWLAATVHRAGEADTGPSRLADGTPFADLVTADPVAWFGPQGAGPAGPADTGILVKLLDADQRLPVHVHPDRPFAASHLHSCYGKTEAWYVLAAEGENPSVWLGFADDVDPAELAAATEAQDSAWMLSRMNRVPVEPGTGILVPAGTAHAIGEGVFVVEVQEPTDLSILLEWSITTSGREDSHLDLGFDVALTAVSHQRLDSDRLADLVRQTDPAHRSAGGQSVLPPAADEFFRIRVLAPTAQESVSAAPGFAVAVVLDGAGTLTGAGGELAVDPGQVLAIPAAFGPWSVSGGLRLVQCLPGPRPAALITTGTGSTVGSAPR
ncbi:class I mannose-6-phosphate isomerase [Nakamurella lactea]|uniref:class I mannose-6-phosphate isomerase n=1 Tax=Nakamurella lactea TaxID=459515 RepID=UPI003898D6B7